MKKKTAFLIIGIEVFVFLFLLSSFSIPCVFKTVLSVPCPGCGLTRAFRALLEGRILEAFSYNILLLPCILFFLYFHYFILKDIIRKKEIITIPILKKKNMFWMIGILLVMSEIYNLVMGI